MVDLTIHAVQDMIDQHQQLPGNIRRVGGILKNIAFLFLCFSGDEGKIRGE